MRSSGPLRAEPSSSAPAGARRRSVTHRSQVTHGAACGPGRGEDRRRCRKAFVRSGAIGFRRMAARLLGPWAIEKSE